MTSEANMYTETEGALVTMDGAVDLIRRETGVPIPKSRLQKDSAKGIAPRPAALYGRRYLYHPEKILEYGRTLIKPFEG
jgi:hypothetical protein